MANIINSRRLEADSTSYLLVEETEHRASSRHSVLVHVLALFFGISSWIEISGLSVELPLMVESLPEGWKLPSYVVVVTQLANIGPLIYSVARKYWSYKVLEIPTIHGTLGIAFVSCLLLSFFWDQTSVIGGYEHSTVLIILCFFLAFVDCTSSVLYLPFMARFHETYVISCMIGEGMSGFFPSIMGVGGNSECHNVTSFINTTDGSKETVQKLIPYIPKPVFSVGVYFIFLCLMILVSWAAFVMLDKLPRVQREKVFSPETSAHKEDPELEDDSDEWDRSDIPHNNTSRNYLEQKAYSRSDFCVLLSIQTYVCVMQNGVLSSIQSFSCLPYGNLTYHLSVNFSMMSNPVGCFIALFVPVWTVKSVVLWTVFGSVWAVYILVAALLSPYPPLVDNTFGAILMCFSWTIFVGSVSYVKASIVAILRRSSGNTGLFWGGAVSQVGSFVGGVVMFVVVNYTDLFKKGPECSS